MPKQKFEKVYGILIRDVKPVPESLPDLEKAFADGAMVKQNSVWPVTIVMPCCKDVKGFKKEEFPLHDVKCKCGNYFVKWE